MSLSRRTQLTQISTHNKRQTESAKRNTNPSFALCFFRHIQKSFHLSVFQFSVMKDVVVIGVAGGTGSGKSTLVKRLQEAFRNDDVATICHDFYYKAHPELTYEERTKLNYDHPDAFDTWLMVEHIKALKEGKSVECPTYSFVEHNRTDETMPVKPSKVVIVDGILIFENEELRNIMDIKVYVDTDADIRLARRILRDVRERGRSMESVISQYTTTVKPMHEQFVEPSKRYADVIIPEGGFNSVAVSMLIQNIRSIVEK